jgi:thiosulfate/3-mercaptopyruvate sulfurtransferase
VRLQLIPTPRPRMTNGDTLVSPQWLEKHLRDPGILVIEIDVAPARYDAGHIEGAVLWNVYSDLKNADYQLVDKEAIAALLSRSGVESDSTVVFYGYAPAMGFWLMKLYRHIDVRILDCSRELWREQQRPWTTEVVTPPATHYELPEEDGRIRASHKDVSQAIGDRTRTILDVRSKSEFQGERFWPSGGAEEGGRAGHVPTAINLSIEGLLDEAGSFCSKSELRAQFSVHELGVENGIITYCTIGGRASSAWFALTYLLGYKNVRVYDGSWAEWGRMQGVAVETAAS